MPLSVLILSLFTIEGVIITVSLIDGHKLTVNANHIVVSTLFYLFVIVPFTYTIYTPPSVGLVHDIFSVVESKLIKSMLYELSAVIVAVYSISDALQYIVFDTVNYGTF